MAQLTFVGEAAVERARPDPREPGDLVEAGGCYAAVSKQLSRCRQDSLAIS